MGQSGFTHTGGGKALGDYTGSVRAHKEKADAAYNCGPHLTSACTLDPGMATQRRRRASDIVSAIEVPYWTFIVMPWGHV